MRRWKVVVKFWTMVLCLLQDDNGMVAVSKVVLLLLHLLLPRIRSILRNPAIADLRMRIGRSFLLQTRPLCTLLRVGRCTRDRKSECIVCTSGDGDGSISAYTLAYHLSFWRCSFQQVVQGIVPHPLYDSIDPLICAPFSAFPAGTGLLLLARRLP